MVFDVVRPDRHDDVGVLEVAPVGRHRAAAEGRGEARHGRGVADARLVVDGDDAQASRELLHEPGFFVVQLCGAQARDPVAAVHRHVAFLLDEGGVAGLLHALGDGVDRFFPGNLFPFLGTGTTNERRQHAVRVEFRTAFLRHDIAKAPHRGALRAEAAEVHRMVRVAFKVDEFAVAGRADRAAAAGAVAADVGRFLDVDELVGLLGGRRPRLSGLSQPCGHGGRTEEQTALEETSARDFHESS